MASTPFLITLPLSLPHLCACGGETHVGVVSRESMQAPRSGSRCLVLRVVAQHQFGVKQKLTRRLGFG